MVVLPYKRLVQKTWLEGFLKNAKMCKALFPSSSE